VGERGWGGWRGKVGGLTMPIDTGNQFGCTVGQTDGHSSPDHTMSHADIQWDRTPSYSINAPQGLHMVRYGPS